MMEHARSELVKNINSLIPKQNQKYPHLTPIIDYMRDQAILHKNISIWTGLWSTQLLQSIQSLLISSNKTKSTKPSTICKLSRRWYKINVWHQW